ncbi:MAG: helicase-related protein [Candidatus Lokiarchaeota archaeon]
MVKVLDNSPGKEVLDSIKNLINDSEEACIAVGYFYVNGWNSVRNNLPSNVRNQFIKIIIGQELNQPTFEEISKGYKFRVQTQLLEDLDEINDISSLEHLYELIKEGIIDVRIYTKGRLHSKLYLFIKDRSSLEDGSEFPPGTAIVGSSNFTISGTTKNKELNVSFTDREQVLFLYDWFNNLWKTESDDFREDLIRIIESSNALDVKKNNPFGTYVSPETLFKYLSYIWLNGKIAPIEKEDVLAKFQLIGVLNAIEMITEFNGAIVADNVGLGKSFIGATIIEEYITGKLMEWDPKYYEYEKPRKALLILPPSLIKQWKSLLFDTKQFFSKQIITECEESEEKFEKYNIIGSEESNAIGEVSFLSLGKFALMDPEEIYERNLHYQYDLILIDEAHKFRNRRTKRWDNIQALRFKENNDPNSFRNKFLLLTATPVNNNIWDAYNLIRMFSDDDFTNFKKRSIKISELFSEYRSIKKKWQEDKSFEGDLRIKAREIKNKVFQRIMILRTRNYIMEKFGKDGKIQIGDSKYSFKDPIPERISYESEKPEFNSYNEFVEHLDEIFEDLNFSFTHLYSSGYVAFTSQEEEGEVRVVPINAILKFLLSKRLESSIFGFERTLKKLFRKNKMFNGILNEFITNISSLSNQDFIKKLRDFSQECIVKAGKEDLLEDFQEDEINFEEKKIPPPLRLVYNLLELNDIEHLNLFETTYDNIDDFYSEIMVCSEFEEIIDFLKTGLSKIKEEITKDSEILQKVIELINNIKVTDEDGTTKLFNGEIPHYHDPKLAKLKEVIYSELVGKKYIIFTQYLDTAKYIYTTLKDWIQSQKITLNYLFFNSSLRIALVSGKTKTSTKNRIIDRFAPIANNASGDLKGEELEILISTDSLSEGVNLQDADGVINYDLPWNPMKIVQRIGRVNRIGNEKDIFVKNFSPAKELETIIGILEKLSNKIKDITYLVGKEYYILSEDEEISPEIFEHKLVKLADSKMSQLEELSEVGDAKFLGNIIQDEEVAKFELLNFIQNKLKLREDEFEGVKKYIENHKPIYTLTDLQDLIRVYEISRGKTRTGRYILKIRDDNIEETTCREFLNLWNAKPSLEEFKVPEVKEKIDLLDSYFEEEIIEEFKGLETQRGFLRNLFAQLRLMKVNTQLVDVGIDYQKLDAILDKSPYIELNTHEIHELKQLLYKSKAISEKSNRIKNYPLLVEKTYEFLKVGKKEGRMIKSNILGWWM